MESPPLGVFSATSVVADSLDGIPATAICCAQRSCVDEKTCLLSCEGWRESCRQYTEHALIRPYRRCGVPNFQLYLGVFATKNEAIDAYDDALCREAVKQRSSVLRMPKKR